MCRHICKTDGFGSAAEAQLFRQAQAGCAECLGALMARHERLVYAVVRRQGAGALPMTEAVQAGRIGLWRAILRYDPARGAAFSTYAWPAIVRHIWQAGEMPPASRTREREVAGSVAAPLDPANGWERQVRQGALSELVYRLPQRLRRVVVARYGLDGQAPASYAHIGAELGLTGERARQLHTEALVWLRQPAHSYCLRSLLERHTLAEYQSADEVAQAWLRRRAGKARRHEC